MFIYGQLRYIIESLTVAVIATFLIAPLISKIFEIDDKLSLNIFLTTFTTYVLYNLYYTYKEHQLMKEVNASFDRLEKKSNLKLIEVKKN
jgi:hypothetical protein